MLHFMLDSWRMSLYLIEIDLMCSGSECSRSTFSVYFFRSKETLRRSVEIHYCEREEKKRPEKTMESYQMISTTHFHFKQVELKRVDCAMIHHIITRCSIEYCVYISLVVPIRLSVYSVLSRVCV